MQFSPQMFSFSVSTCTSIKAVKQQLINDGTVVFNHCDFKLVYLQGPRKVKLDDTSLPLHYYAIDNGAFIVIEKTYLLVKIERVGEKGQWIKRMPKTANVCDLKKVILKGICNESVFDVQGRIQDLIRGGPDRDRPKTAILGPQFCRILVLGPQFWWSGGAGPPGPPWIRP